MVKEYKTPDNLSAFSNLKPFRWQVFQVILMFFYLTVVAQSAEIVVKCRPISAKFKDPEIVSLFVFFEMEVWAFLGIIAGIWAWLSLKFLHNSFYKNGP